MQISKRTRKELIDFLLPRDYCRQIVARLAEKGVTVHPNTVRNVLNGSKNPTVALELVKLGNEMKARQRQFTTLEKKLTPAK